MRLPKRRGAAGELFDPEGSPWTDVARRKTPLAEK